MDNPLTSSTDTHTQLQRGKQREGWQAYVSGKALRHQATQHLPNSDGMVASFLLLAGQERGTTEMRDDSRWARSAASRLTNLVREASTRFASSGEGHPRLPGGGLGAGWPVWVSSHWGKI